MAIEKTILQLLLLLSVIIAASKGAGAVSKRLGQPAVFGELLVGLLLGPTLFNLLEWPVFTHHEYLQEVIHDLAELGVIFLMFLAGFETDLQEMRRVGTAATAGALGGMLLPFLGGLFIGLGFGYSMFASIFMGTILTATSVSISAQTLIELGRLRSREGTTILGAAVIDDVLGILLLSVVVALHGAAGTEAGVPIWLIVVKMVAFFAVAVALGKWLVPGLLRATRHWPGTEVSFALTVVLGLLFAFGAEALGGVAAITGSYTLGVMLAQHHDLRHGIEEKLKTLAYGFFVPIFFVSVGLAGNLVEALGESGVTFTLLVVAAAVLGKVLGCGLLVRPLGFSWIESTRVGVGMVSRGEVGLIIAGLGLSTGVIDSAVYSVMIVMVLFTTLLTPILLRLAFRGGRDTAAPRAGHQAPVQH